MTTDAHPLRGTVLRALQVAPRNSAELARAIAQHSPRNIGFAVAALVDERLVALRWGRYRLTAAGQTALRSTLALPPMRPYVPPMVVRRPGSDHSAIPSLAGGRLIRRSA